MTQVGGHPSSTPPLSLRGALPLTYPPTRLLAKCCKPFAIDRNSGTAQIQEKIAAAIPQIHFEIGGAVLDVFLPQIETAKTLPPRTPKSKC